MPNLITAELLASLLPRDVRAELCIASVAVPGPGDTVEFRTDPGRVYARHATIAATGNGRYAVAIADRHRPGDPPEPATGAWGMTETEVPDELRGAAGRAWTLAAGRPHWRATFGDERPQALGLWAGPYASPAMAIAVEKTAKETGATCFFCLRGGWNQCLTVPPGDAATVLSVTPEGAWSLHDGVDTCPLTGLPGEHALSALRVGGPVARLQPVAAVPRQDRIAADDDPAAIRGLEAVPDRRGTARNASGTRKNQRKGTAR